MSWFRRRPTEDEIERAVLYAAMLARANERDKARLSTEAEIADFLDVAFGELKVRPDKQQKQMAHMGVDALLVESDFLEELLQFRLSNPDAALPVHFRDKMLAAIEKTVNVFMGGR